MSFNKLHSDLESVQDLTRDTVYSIVSDALKIPAEHINPQSHLVDDLGMTKRSKNRLQKLIMTYFDDLILDLDCIETIQELIDHTLKDEIDEMEYEKFPF